MMGLQWMAQGGLQPDRVHVAAPDPRPLHVPTINKIGHDPVRSPLTDPDQPGDLRYPNLRVLGNANQHMTVIGQKRPTQLLLRYHRLYNFLRRHHGNGSRTAHQPCRV